MITGAASGIGRACAELFADQHAEVLVADIDYNGANSVAKKIVNSGVYATAVELDVTRESSWQDAVDCALKQHGQLDVLINNAGIAYTKSIAECSYEAWRRVIAVNLDGVFLGVRAGMSAMTSGGVIINVASVAGIAPNGGSSAYNASKAAIRMLSKTAAIECADENTGIRVNLVSPSGVRTPMWQTQPFFKELVAEHGGMEEAFAALDGREASRKFCSSQDVAETVLYLASNASSHLTGIEIVMDCGHSG